MSTKNPFVEDFAKVASSAMSTFSGLRDEAQSAMRARFDAMLADMDMITRDEFDAVRAMAIKAREENDALRAELEALKSKIPAAKAKPAPRKTAAKSTTAKKPARKTPTKS
ncbi:MAG: accessory factor UbiK family protein [Pseudomonadota bacterium]